jgi:DNA-binding beta-propeller fold protein YncE
MPIPPPEMGIFAILAAAEDIVKIIMAFQRGSDTIMRAGSGGQSSRVCRKESRPMKQRTLIAAAAIFLISTVSPSAADVSVTTIDFLKEANLAVNAAGPVLVRIDVFRNRLVAANTLSSSLSFIDCRDHSVLNVPVGGRAVQHLKGEALTLRKKTGEAYLIGSRCLSIASSDGAPSRTIPTGAQFESIAVDEETGNAFLAGRESKELGFYSAKSGKLAMLPWLATREDLVNLNATPPPPIRKVVAAPELKWIIGIDGYTSTMFLFDGRTGKLINTRGLELTGGGRWHLAGYDETTHRLYVVVETNARRVIEAAKIDVLTGEAEVVQLPQFTEGVGIIYNPARDEVYIPYDNHPSVHVVDFRNGGAVAEIKLPAYGNDASAVDEKNGILYVASWAHGEIDVVDLTERALVKRITDLGIIPHMFTLAYNPNDNLLYYPKGASAVNGTFGAAVTALDPATGAAKKVYTGWAPIDLVEVKARNSLFVFDSEDQFAEVHRDGTFELHRLPRDYPLESIVTPAGNVYLSYGPHQSYWPVVYIWGAKDGILGIAARDLAFYDRRIPRQAQRMVFDTTGTLYFTQNLWGKEEQMLGTLADEIRLFDIGARIAVADTIERENTQRILRFDPGTNRIYLARVAEKDGDPGILHVIDPAARKDIARIALGSGPSDLAFDEGNIYVANFESKSVSIIGKTGFAESKIVSGNGPLKLCRLGDRVYVINHMDNALQEVREGGATYRIPYEGLPDNLFAWGDKLVVTSHSSRALFVCQFDPSTARFTLLHSERYPYGDTRFDSRNVSFYLSGQFGDAIYSLTNARTASDGRLWISDFLSGRLMILERK